VSAPKKTVRRRTRPHPVTKRELRENNPVLVNSFNKKMGPYYKGALIIIAVVTVLGFAWQGWVGMGGKTLVTDRTLEESISGVKKEVGVKIDDTKREVVKNQNDIKTEITGSLGELTKTLGTISKSQNASAMESAEMASKLAFTQLQSLQGQLATVKLALSKDQNDTMLQTRVLQLETFIKQNERDMQDAKDKMSRLRNGQ
jgi:hypothetical protein